jgi:hypothetical protein
MAPSPRGKQADQTGTWSESKWDEGRQLWYNDRIGPSGEIEYHYHQDLTTINDPSIPRGGAGFGTQNTSASTPYQDPSTYSSSAAGGAAYPPVADSYTTSSSGASWYGSNPPYSSAYGAQISSIDNEASSSLEYAGNTGSSSQPTQYGSQYGSGSTDTRMAQFSSGAVFDSYPSVESGKQGVQDLASAFSGMKLNPITEGGTCNNVPMETVAF